ncbi:MAG: 5-(carboxyamino)imidazole ribonucleotide mutase, partial [Lachnospiraceae bacterium]
EMLSIKYPEIKEDLINFRIRMKKRFIEENAEGVDL